MEKKYELTDETITTTFGTVLHRIKALRGLGFGFVKVGDLGGYIEKESNLSHCGNAWVYDNAQVWGDAVVSDYALVSGDAQVQGNARVCGDAQVRGNAVISDNAVVSGNSLVYDNAVVSGNARILDYAWISGDAMVCDNAVISGNTGAYDNTQACNNGTELYSDAKAIHDAVVFDIARVCGVARVCGNAHVYGNALISSDDDLCTFDNKDITAFKTTDGKVNVVCNDFIGTLDGFRAKAGETHATELLMIADLIENKLAKSGNEQ